MPNLKKSAAAPDDAKAKLIDEFGELERRMDEFDPVVRRHKAIQDEILSWVKDLPADQATTLSGNLYTIQVSERQYERKITSMRAVYKALGNKVAVLLDHVTMTLKELDVLIPAYRQGDLVTKARTGRRMLVPVARTAAKSA